MKKILGVVLAVLALSIFTACGSSKAMEQSLKYGVNCKNEINGQGFGRHR